MVITCHHCNQLAIGAVGIHGAKKTEYYCLNEKCQVAFEQKLKQLRRDSVVHQEFGLCAYRASGWHQFCMTMAAYNDLCPEHAECQCSHPNCLNPVTHHCDVGLSLHCGQPLCTEHNACPRHTRKD